MSGLGGEWFRRHVEHFFTTRPCKDPKRAEEAIMLLYDYLLAKALEMGNYKQSELEWVRRLVQIQQAMTWTPLRLFWEALVLDELLPIRAAAKGNIAEATGEYWQDSEAAVMAHANLPFVLSGAMDRLQEEIAADPNIRLAQGMWDESTEGVSFAPHIVIRDLTEDIGPEG